MPNHRLQFDFTEETLKELDTLREETGLPTRAALMRYALKFLRWTLQETQEKGDFLLLKKSGKVREVVSPFWTVSRKSV